MLEVQRKKLEELHKENKAEEIIVKIIYIIFFIAYNLFELYLVYLIGKYTNKLVELGIVLVFFFLNKSMFGKALHYRDNFKCNALSMIVFYTSSKIIFNTGISLITSVIVGVLCGGITSYIGTYMHDADVSAKKRNLVKELVELDLDVDKIQEICKKNGLDEEIGYMVDFRLNHNEELTCYEFSIDKSTLNRKINRFLRVAK